MENSQLMVHTVVEAGPHPNADRLRCYTMRGTDGVLRRIVSNLTNIYVVGEQVNVVTAPGIWDDTEIVERKVRGEISQGMAVGHVE